MKRFVVAGFFFMLGLLILGVVTSYLISPDRPQFPQRPAVADEMARAHGPNLQQQQSRRQPQQGVAPYMTPANPVQPAAAPLPGMPVPLSTTVPPAAIKPVPADNAPHVPVISPTDESSSRGR